MQSSGHLLKSGGLSGVLVAIQRSPAEKEGEGSLGVAGCNPAVTCSGLSGQKASSELAKKAGQMRETELASARRNCADDGREDRTRLLRAFRQQALRMRDGARIEELDPERLEHPNVEGPVEVQVHPAPEGPDDRDAL